MEAGIASLFIASCVLSILLARPLVRLYYKCVRANDKRRMETAIMREEYLNQLYEETMYEHMDSLARQAKQQMMRVHKRR